MLTRAIESEHRVRWIVLSALLAVAGCGGGPFQIVSVSGVVTYEDGEPIPSGDYRLKFVPQVESPDGKNFPRAATVMVGSDGVFEYATTHKHRDGLIYGKHKVYFRISPDSDGNQLVPEAYQAAKTTPLEIDVSKTRSIEIRVPRP